MRRASVVPVVVLALVVGCTGGPADRADGPTPPSTGRPAPTSTIPPDELADLAVEIRQSRRDWGDRVVQLRVRNGGDDVVTVTAGELTTDFTGVSATDPGWSRAIPAGRHRDASLALGPPLCPAPGARVMATVRVEVVDDTGRTGEVSVRPDDPQGHLDRIRREDCAQAAVLAGAGLSFGPELTVEERDGRLVASLSLTAAPVPGGPSVSFVALEGSGLFKPPDGHVWTLTGLGEPVRAEQTVELPVVPTRCDPHAVAEDKRGTYFAVQATADGARQPVFYLGTGDDLRGQLYEFVGRYCGWSADPG